MGIQIRAISCHLYKFSTNFQQYQNFFMIVRTESCNPRFSITCWLNASLQYSKLSHIYMFCLRQFFIVLQKKTTDNTLFHRTNPRIIQCRSLTVCIFSKTFCAILVTRGVKIFSLQSAIKQFPEVPIVDLENQDPPRIIFTAFSEHETPEDRRQIAIEKYHILKNIVIPLRDPLH